MNMNFGKKISLSQKIGIEGETEVKLWLSKSCHITANKLENDFGIDFIGQWHGNAADKPNTWWVSPRPISIAVRATTNEKGKIRIDKADAKVLLDNPCIFLVMPHFKIEPHRIYAKFIDIQFIDELNLFIDGNKKQKTISIKNCLSDIQDINKQISLLLSPAYAKKIEMHKIKIGLLKISSTGQITINHRDGDSYAFIETENFNELFSETDTKLRHDAIWGGLKYHKKYMSKFNSSRKFKRQFVDYLHSLPVTKAILLGNDEKYFNHVVAFVGNCEIKTKAKLPPSLVIGGIGVVSYIKTHKELFFDTETVERLVSLINDSRIENNWQNRKAHINYAKSIVKSKKNNNSIPNCPACGAVMAKRQAKRGNNKGNFFWGCTNYPKCREIINLNINE